MIRVKSMKLFQDQFKAVSELLKKEWISLEDIQMKLSSLKKSQRMSMVDQRNSVVGPSTLQLPSDDETTGGGCCLCCCMSSRQRHSKPTKSSKKYMVGSNQPDLLNGAKVDPTDQNVSGGSGGLSQKNPLGLIVTYQPSKSASTQELTLECVSGGGIGGNSSSTVVRRQDETSVEHLRSVANALQEKCEELYATLSDPTTTANARLLKYFEQDRAVLVLTTESREGLEILSICTMLDQVARLKTDHAAGKLTADLERVVMAPDILQKIGAVGIQLEVGLDSDDLDLAKQELT